MRKYRVYGIYTASKVIGEYEANSKEEALEMASSDSEADSWPSLCHQCSNEIDLTDDPYEYQAVEIK